MCIKKVVCSNCELLIGQYDSADQAGFRRKNLSKIQNEIFVQYVSDIFRYTLLFKVLHGKLVISAKDCIEHFELLNDITHWPMILIA